MFIEFVHTLYDALIKLCTLKFVALNVHVNVHNAGLYLV